MDRPGAQLLHIQEQHGHTEQGILRGKYGIKLPTQYCFKLPAEYWSNLDPVLHKYGCASSSRGCERHPERTERVGKEMATKITEVLHSCTVQYIVTWSMVNSVPSNTFSLHVLHRNWQKAKKARDERERQ